MPIAVCCVIGYGCHLHFKWQFILTLALLWIHCDFQMVKFFGYVESHWITCCHLSVVLTRQCVATTSMHKVTNVKDIFVENSWSTRIYLLAIIHHLWVCIQKLFSFWRTYAFKEFFLKKRGVGGYCWMSWWVNRHTWTLDSDEQVRFVNCKESEL